MRNSPTYLYGGYIMDKQILAELHKVEQELAKLSKLKATKTVKQRKLKLTRRKATLQSQAQARKVKEETKPRKATATSEVKVADKATNKPKAKTKKQRKQEKKEKLSAKKGKKKLKIKTIPFGELPTIPEINTSEPMSLIGMLVTGIVDRIEQALDGRSELVEIHTGTGNHVDTAEYNGIYISARSYYHRLDVAARSTVLVKICEEAKKEVTLLNENDEDTIKAYSKGKLVSNILIEKQNEILARLFRWVFDSEQSEDGLSSVDALFPFTEAFGGTRYQAELNTALDEAANEDLTGGIEKEQYDPKNTFTGYLTGREFVILPDDTIQPLNDSNINFKKGADGKYLIGGKSYTLKEAIERL